MKYYACPFELDFKHLDYLDEAARDSAINGILKEYVYTNLGLYIRNLDALYDILKQNNEAIASDDCNIEYSIVRLHEFMERHE